MKFSKLSLVVLSIFGSTCFGLDVFVAPVSTRGAATEDASVVTDLLRNAVDQTRGFRSVDAAAPQQLTLEGRLLKLGSAYLLTLRRSDQARPAAELKVANLDDMHLATQRLVRKVLVGGGDAPKVGEVTEADEHANDRRVQATRQFQIGFGPAWTSNLRSSGPSSTWGLGYLWGVESDYEILVRGEFLSSSQSTDVSFGSLTIGLNYLFLRDRHSPFVSADFGYGWASAERGCASLACRMKDGRDEANGWQVGLGAGYKFFRTSNVNLALALRYEMLTATVSRGAPSKTSIQVLLYF